MSKASHLFKRQGRFYYFVRIPSDLQHFFNSPFIKKSLKTTDKYAAKEDAIVLEHKVSRAFRLIRSGLLSEEQVSSIVSELFPKRNGNGDGSKGGIRLSGLMEAYTKEHEHRWGPKTKMENLGTFKLINDVIGDVELKLLSKKTIVDLREKLCRLPANVYKLYPEPLAKVYAKRRIHRLSRIEVELHRQVHDIVGLRDTTSQEDADEAQGKNIMVDGDITAKFVSPS